MVDISETRAGSMVLNIVTKERSKELTAEVTSSPLLPILGWTKLIESVVASGPVLNWLVYAMALTVVYVFADELKRRMEYAAWQAEDMMEAEPMYDEPMKDDLMDDEPLDEELENNEPGT